MVEKAVSPEPFTADPTVEALLNEYEVVGAHPERLKFEALVLDWSKKPTGISATIDVWDFIDDAIEGTGGFADGSYLIPHRREIKSRGRTSVKFQERIECADYDNFAKTVAAQPVDYIVQSQDMIGRDAGGETDLEEWWKNVDGEGTSMTDFITEFPAMQARAYGTAWIFMDRPPQIKTLKDDSDPANWPYLYCVPTRNIIYWKVSRRGALEGVVVLEPRSAEEQRNPAKAPVRVWTRFGWGTYERIETAQGGKKTSKYVLTGSGTNDLGIVPAVRLHDEKPKPGKGLGTSVMLGVARIARTCFNLDSEIRELERNTAFSFLALPTKNASTFDETKVALGTNRILPYDGDGGPPAWIASDTEQMVKLRERKKEKKEEAFGMAHMAAVAGFVETSSGFHAEAEFDKTNRRIGKFAKSLELAETELLKLWRLYMGRKEATKAAVAYPRDFNIRDLDKVYDRVQKRLNLNLGVADATDAIFDFYCALYPRKDRAELRTMAEKAAGDRETDKELERAAMQGPPTAKDRAANLIKARKSA